jgi:hypothetical protein
MTCAVSRDSIFRMNRRMRLALLLIIAVIGTFNAHAAGSPYIGPYAGGDVLMERLHPTRGNLRTQIPDSKARNDRDLGWKGMVGVRMSSHFAFEAGFTDFGELSAAPVGTGGPSRVRARAFTAFAVGLMPAGPVDVFAKAGPTRLQSTGHFNGSYFDRQQRKISGGAGVQLNRRRLVLRLEYEKFGTGVLADLDMLSLGFRLSLRPQ